VRRKPEVHIDPRLPQIAGPMKRPPPNTRGDVIVPFLASGGMTLFLVDDTGDPGFDPREAGVQFVTFVYVPFGQIGFLKELRVAPFIPPVFADPWNSSGLVSPGGLSPAWRTWTNAGDPNVPTVPRAAGTNGVWTTPLGWESYFDDGEQAPSWRWHLRLLDGNVNDLRISTLNLPQFGIGNPASWPFVQNIPVPASAYAGGIPGRAPGPAWGPQRMQVLQADELATHVMIPENTSLCLFTEWRQTPCTPRAQFFVDPDTTDQSYGAAEYPLLPSFGQLHGYMQGIADAEAVTDNALFGWGG
jgi:hypothetical protein